MISTNMEKQRKSNRDTVLQVAAHLFLTKGYQLTSMDEIVDHCKVSKTNIYYHFKSKEELLLQIINRFII
ncbi:TetR/AcrR family transcriptional regulator [Paenibacillus sp. JCM 10914]|uniref:TetR/AcrR family transcriptional regulator n=1 Tax=Paenibacillus sp. JCM 10914 TaxID=1236974 RepID=UPI00351BF733